MFTPEVHIDEIAETSLDHQAASSYLDKYLKVSHPDLDCKITEPTPKNLVISCQRDPGGYSSPAGIQQVIEKLMTEEFGMKLIDSDISFPSDENDLNDFQINLKFV